MTNDQANQIQALKQAVEDLIGIIEGEDLRAITIMAALHGHGFPEEVARKNEKIIDNARKLIKK